MLHLHSRGSSHRDESLRFQADELTVPGAELECLGHVVARRADHNATELHLLHIAAKLVGEGVLIAFRAEETLVGDVCGEEPGQPLAHLHSVVARLEL